MSTKDTPSQGTSSANAGGSQAPADVFDPFSAPPAANAAPSKESSDAAAKEGSAAEAGTAEGTSTGQAAGPGDAPSPGADHAQETASKAAGSDAQSSAGAASAQDTSAPAAVDPMNMLFQAPDLASITPVKAPRQAHEDDDSDRGNQGAGSRRSSSRRDGSSDQGASDQQAESGGQGDAAHRSDEDQSRGDSAGARAAADGGSSSAEQGESEDQSGGSRKSRRKRRRGGGRGKNRAEGDAAAEAPTADSTSTGGGKASESKADGSKGSSDAQRDNGDDDASDEDSQDENSDQVIRKRRRRRRGDVDMEVEGGDDESTHTVTRVRAPREGGDSATSDKVTGLKGSTRLEAKRQRRRASREGGRRRQIVTEAEFLARRESVDRKMIVRQRQDRIQIGVLEDGVLAEHFVSNTTQDSLIGNVYLGKVQNVLPSMEAAFVDIGRGRNAVLYAGEVDWSAANLGGSPRKIENALKSGDSVLVQVTKDPVGHKGARLTSQVSLPGRYLVFVPGGSMTGISRKLPDTERARLKKILKEQMPEDSGVIVRTAAEGASEEELTRDINRLRALWETIQSQRADKKVLAPELLYSEPDLTIKVVRDVFNEDFSSMEIQGEETWDNIEAYVTYVAPHLLDRLHRWDNEDQDRGDIFAHHRIDEQLNKALDRKVNLPSGGSLVFDRTEAMTVVDVNTGKFTGSGGNLEETVTRNNLEAAEEIVRQLRLRDIGGIIVMDFIDMVLESNRDLVLRRLVECLGRDRTKHQVAEVTSLGLVQMTRKRMGTGLLEVFSEPCEHCSGRGSITHEEPIQHRASFTSHGDQKPRNQSKKRRKGKGGSGDSGPSSSSGSNRQDSEAQDRDRQEKEKQEKARQGMAQVLAATTNKTDEGKEGSGSADGEGRAKDDSKPKGDGRSKGDRSSNAGRGSTADHGAKAVDAAGAAPEDAAGGSSAEPEAKTLTIGGETVRVPRGKQSSDGSAGKNSSASALDSLDAAVASRQPRSASGSDAGGGSAPRRRRRAAGSVQGAGGQIQSFSPDAGESGRTATFTQQKAAAGSIDATPAGDASTPQGAGKNADKSKASSAGGSKDAAVMLGVGVKAEDISRGDSGASR